MHGNHPQGHPRGSAHNATSRTATPVARQLATEKMTTVYRVDWTTWWLWRGARTRSHPELGRENPQRPWYCVLRHGRVGRRQVFQSTLFPPRMIGFAPRMRGGLRRPPVDAGWSSPVARQAHNLKAAGSNPAPATKSSREIKEILAASRTRPAGGIVVVGVMPQGRSPSTSAEQRPDPPSLCHLAGNLCG